MLEEAESAETVGKPFRCRFQLGMVSVTVAFAKLRPRAVRKDLRAALARIVKPEP